MQIKLQFSFFTKFAITVLLVSLAGSAVATVIYDSGTPNNAQWRNSDFSNIHSGRAADDFVLATDEAVTDIHWFGSYLFTPTQPMPDEFTIHFYNDEANMPTVDPFHIATFTSPVNRSFTGDIITTDWGEFEMYEYDVDISALSLMADTRYWLSIVNDTHDPNGYGGWAWAYNQDGSGTTHRWRKGDGDWMTFGSSNLAFSLTTHSVPEPATLALMSLGLAGMGFSHKRKAAQSNLSHRGDRK